MRTQKRRRRENKTDYKLRLGLLKSHMPRIVIRKSNKYFIIQIIESNEAQDVVKKTVSSKDLLKNGWEGKFKGSLKSIPAAYLTGLLTAKDYKKGKFILDIGLARHKPGSRIYAAAKGLVDGGLDIKIDESVFPSEEKLYGKDLDEKIKPMIKNLISKLKNG